jgi:hypothetical protein
MAIGIALTKWRQGMLKKLAEIRKDYLLHYFYGSLVGLVMVLVTGDYWLGLIAVWIVALAKEVYDSWSDGDPDPVDVLATVAGGVVVVLPMMLL